MDHLNHNSPTLVDFFYQKNGGSFPKNVIPMGSLFWYIFTYIHEKKHQESTVRSIGIGIFYTKKIIPWESLRIGGFSQLLTEHFLLRPFPRRHIECLRRSTPPVFCVTMLSYRELKQVTTKLELQNATPCLALV